MIKLELTVSDCNIILRALGKQPFEEVTGVITKIKTQGDPQAQATIQAEQNVVDTSDDLPKE